MKRSVFVLAAVAAIATGSILAAQRQGGAPPQPMGFFVTSVGMDGGNLGGLQGGLGVGGFELGFGQAKGLHHQGEAQAQPQGEGGVFPGVGADGGQHVSTARAGVHRRK